MCLIQSVRGNVLLWNVIKVVRRSYLEGLCLLRMSLCFSKWIDKRSTICVLWFYIIIKWSILRLWFIKREIRNKVKSISKWTVGLPRQWLQVIHSFLQRTINLVGVAIRVIYSHTSTYYTPLPKQQIHWRHPLHRLSVDGCSYVRKSTVYGHGGGLETWSRN